MLAFDVMLDNKQGEGQNQIYEVIKEVQAVKAIWKDVTLAESNKTIVIEGNYYFPPDSLNKEYVRASSTHTTCPWKGEASYYNLVVKDEENRDAAWYYPEPKEAAKEIKNHVAFGKGVKVVS